MHPARLSRLILFALLVGALVALASCTLVGDTTTGVSLSRVNPSPCIKTCVGDMNDLVKAEIAIHKAAIEGCEALPDTDREACLSAEAARHSAAMQQIAGDRRDCLNGCHRQGGGSSG